MKMRAQAEGFATIEKITHQGNDLAFILRANYRADGIRFFTPNNFSQQLGYMSRPQGYVIPPHVHNPVAREVLFTKEVLFVRSGKVRVDFYDDDQNYLESYILNQGDFVLLAYGGHGLEMLEPSELIEIKQGPYAGETDKTRFPAIPPDQIRLAKPE